MVRIRYPNTYDIAKVDDMRLFIPKYTEGHSLCKPSHLKMKGTLERKNIIEWDFLGHTL